MTKAARPGIIFINRQQLTQPPDLTVPMFAFYRLIFAILLLFIAYKKGYGKLFWAAMGFILGPIALIGILVYRKNANYSKALLNAVSGILVSAFLIVAAWSITSRFLPPQTLENAVGGREVFWYRIMPMASASIGFIIFCSTMARTSVREDASSSQDAEHES